MGQFRLVSFKLVFFLFAIALLVSSCEPASFTSPLSPLPIPTLSSTEIAIRQMLATKAALTIQENLTEIAPHSASYPPATKLLKPTPANLPTEAPPSTAFPPLAQERGVPAGAGVIMRMIPPYYVHGFGFENTWVEDNATGTIRTFVTAGYSMGPGGEITQQGLVDVRVLKNNYGNIEFIYQKQILTPIQAGSLHVVDAVGERLILQSTSGMTFYFDVPTLQFVSSIDAVVPTFTPSPVSPLPTPAAFPPMDQWNPTPMGAGFIVVLPLPFNHGVYHIYSQWAEDRQNRQQRVFVYTGELAAPDGGSTNQGVVVVHVWQISVTNNLAAMNLVEQTELRTPVKVGALQIVNALNERLEIQSTNGTTFYFDVPTRQFASSIVAVVPTFTPSPVSPLPTPISPIATPR